MEDAGQKRLCNTGISGIQVEERLALHGWEASAVDAVLISHDHTDHSRGMGILHRKFGLPLVAMPNRPMPSPMRSGVDGSRERSESRLLASLC